MYKLDFKLFVVNSTITDHYPICTWITAKFLNTFEALNKTVDKMAKFSKLISKSYWNSVFVAQDPASLTLKIFITL